MDVLNAEFERLLTSSGWKQSEAARHLELSPAVVTRYLSNDTRPSLTVLKLFKLLIGDMHPLPGQEDVFGLDGELERPLDTAERQLLAHLRTLPESQRRKTIQGICAVLGAITTNNNNSGNGNRGATAGKTAKPRGKKRQNRATGAKD